jgi:hypothetical protein
MGVFTLDGVCLLSSLCVLSLFQGNAFYVRILAHIHRVRLPYHENALGSRNAAVRSSLFGLHSSQSCEFPDVIVKVKALARGYDLPILNPDVLGHVFL